ncbi:hypothetical protein F0M18_16040 [Pseudohalioglobus sediminis]|uniref:Sulfotransferase family protein n=1 Tax=Pseudohalioglobus sediminis TaxID=2606449 RepID=A0A5B0WQ12_9GAMM|nr:hypothetical protein [Pseudohalioglobus sediminis]KAA1189184.1 hypothetical protein F0M18_16040 [Pseudohalioglobus sediminis]
MKRFKTLYLHIGLGKTGTTSVQRDILANAGLLESRYDIHYPTRFPHERHFQGNHSILLRALFSGHPDVRQRLAARGMESDEQLAAYNKRTRACLEQGFRKSKATNLLLSAESVAHFYRPDMLELAEWLRGYAEEVRVVACVRHPVHALSSEIQQRLNIGGVLEDLYQNPPFYRFKSLFQRVENAFGKGSLVVYDFAAAVAHPRGLTGAMFENMGVDVGDSFRPRPPSNTSMSHEAALLISALNRSLPVLVDGKRNPLRRADEIPRLSKIPGRKYTAPAEVYQQVTESMKPDVEWLREHYQLELAADCPTPDADYYSFSEESIEALALQIAEYSRMRYGLMSPLIAFYTRVRVVGGKVYRSLGGSR